MKLQSLLVRAHNTVREARELRAHLRVLVAVRRNLDKSRRPNSDVIVSLTSFPARIGHAWLAIESIFQQTVVPQAMVLVLAEEEFPGRKLPRRIVNQQARGLTVVWVNLNYRSYDKLLPVLERYPLAKVITIDDDKIIPPNLVAALSDQSRENPGWIIGYRGWEMVSRDDELAFGRGWQRATPDSPSERLFFPGNSGVLYPPRSLHPTVHDVDTAMELAPTSDDIWFWACSILNGTRRKCIGGAPHVSVRGHKGTPALSTVNATNDEHHFEAVIEHFGLRESLLKAIT